VYALDFVAIVYLRLLEFAVSERGTLSR
jgi:hypothetical protein